MAAQSPMHVLAVYLCVCTTVYIVSLYGLILRDVTNAFMHPGRVYYHFRGVVTDRHADSWLSIGEREGPEGAKSDARP